MNPYVLTFRSSEEINEEFRRIGVDRGGWDVMAPKAFLRCVKISGVRGFCANILKQEMLSLGGDAALSRGTLTGHDKKTDCLVLGNISSILRLTEKLKNQPFGLSVLGQQIKTALNHYEARRTVLDIAGKKFRLGDRTLVAGIINATPDSFSGDGFLGKDPVRVLERAREMVRFGADILDVGGESTRPGSKPVALKEELRRVVPFLKLLRKHLRVPISIDTTKSEVASAALDLGVSIVNDISALRSDKKMAKVVSRAKAALVLMHMKGAPRTMQKNPVYGDVAGEVVSFLGCAVEKALDAGIARDRLIVDPGIGFGKTLGHNLELLNRLSALRSLGRPVLVGLSRKRFIGKILDADIADRAWGTAASVSLAIANGADIIRVHDVAQMSDVARVCDAIVRQRRPS